MNYKNIKRRERKTGNKLLKIAFAACPTFKSEYLSAINFEENDTDSYDRQTFYNIISNEIVNTFMRKEYNRTLVYNFLRRKILKFRPHLRRLIRLSAQGQEKLKILNSTHILLTSVSKAFKRRAKTI